MDGPGARNLTGTSGSGVIFHVFFSVFDVFHLAFDGCLQVFDVYLLVFNVFVMVLMSVRRLNVFPTSYDRYVLKMEAQSFVC